MKTSKLQSWHCNWRKDLMNGAQKIGYLVGKKINWTMTLYHIQKVNSRCIKNFNVKKKRT
jgi:hypothetical protein